MAAAHRGRGGAAVTKTPTSLSRVGHLLSLLSSTILFFFLWSPLIELKLHLLCDQITLIPSMYFKSLPPEAHSPPKFPSQPLLHELRRPLCRESEISRLSARSASARELPTNGSRSIQGHPLRCWLDFHARRRRAHKRCRRKLVQRLKLVDTRQRRVVNVRECRSREREKKERKRKEKRGKVADMWAPLPGVVNISKNHLSKQSDGQI